MKHKVTCASCEKTEHIIIEGNKILSDWAYFGRIDINSCKTTKYLYSGDFEDILNGKSKKEHNPCYDPSAKPKLVEYWECPDCYKKEVE